MIVCSAVRHPYRSINTPHNSSDSTNGRNGNGCSSNESDFQGDDVCEEDVL